MKEKLTPQEADMIAEPLLHLRGKISPGTVGFGAKLLINQELENIINRIEGEPMDEEIGWTMGEIEDLIRRRRNHDSI
jgi:hypothetical protein